MTQEAMHPDVTLWKPTTTVIPSEGEPYLQLLNKAVTGIASVAGMNYNGAAVYKLLSEWGLPWHVVVAGALLGHRKKDIEVFASEHLPHILFHIRQGWRYINCIEDDDLSTLLSTPYDDLGALLIALAAYYIALQELLYQNQKRRRSLTQREISRVETWESTLIHVAKRLNLWIFKRDIEDLVLQLCEPLQYAKLKEDYDILVLRSEKLFDDFCQIAGAFCQDILQVPMHIYYSFCGVRGFERRRHEPSVGLNEAKMASTPFDLVIFDVIVPTMKDCYTAFGVLSQLGYINDRLTEQIAHPKPNGSSYLAFTLMLEQVPHLQNLCLNDQHYECELQIATQVMHAVTHYGCLYPPCYELYEGKHTSQNTGLSFKQVWNSKEGEIFQSIVKSFVEDQKHKNRQTPIIVFDKRRHPVPLPKGATVLDFAYANDEQLSGHVSGFINDREVPLYRPLDAGDIVDIKLSYTPQKHDYWIERRYVTTPRALNAIKKQRYDEHKGYQLLRKRLEAYRYRLTDEELSEELYDLVKKHHLRSVADYLKQFDQRDDKRYTPEWAAEQIMQQIRERNEQREVGKPKWVVRLDSSLLDKNVYYLPKSFCKKCIPGYHPDSKIVGYVSQREKTLIIHDLSCTRVLKYHEKQQALIYPLTWELRASFRVGFTVTAHDRRGIILDIVQQLRFHQCTLVAFRADAFHKDAHLYFNVETYDVEEALALLQKIKKVKSIIDIDFDPATTPPKIYQELCNRLEQGEFTSWEDDKRDWEFMKARLGPRRPVLHNPFDISRPPAPHMFVGRTNEIKTLQHNLCYGERGKAMFLSGPRRSGKSSLCQYFLHHYVSSPSWFSVYYSLQGAGEQNEETILKTLAEEVCWAFEERFGFQPPVWDDYGSSDPEVRFKRVVKGCLEARQDSRLILALDEFGGTIESYQEGILQERFFTFWRNLMAEVEQLSLLFILPTIPHAVLISGPLSNAFTFVEKPLSIEFLDEPSAQQLLLKPLAEQNIAIHPEVVRRALEVTGRSPYYLTLLGSQLITQLNYDFEKKQLYDEDLKQAIEHLVRGDVKQNFSYYYRELLPEELPIIRSLVHLTQQNHQSSIALRKIAARLRNPMEKVRISLERLREGLILQKHTPSLSSHPYYAFAIELVRLWLVENDQFFTSTDGL